MEARPSRTPGLVVVGNCDGRTPRDDSRCPVLPPPQASSPPDTGRPRSPQLPTAPPSSSLSTCGLSSYRTRSYGIPSIWSGAIRLADDGLITAIVIDVKEEGGAVLPLVASTEAQQIDAVVDPGTDIAAFLQALADRGIYRIARLVTFLDGRFARAHPESALQTQDGDIYVDESGLGWLNPAHPAARAYNTEIAAITSTLFDEVQFDYIRYPGNPRLRVTKETTPAERTAAVTDFTALAAEAVHRSGAAVSFDLFGQTTVVTVEDSIGQIWEEIATHADYLSPMVYPSTWVVGRFGLAYPPAAPGTVVRTSVGSGVERLEGFSAHVRPWLQDFNDYQEQLLPYRALEVKAQIDAAKAVGADGFMLWDPSLNYAMSVLAALRDASTPGD